MVDEKEKEEPKKAPEPKKEVAEAKAEVAADKKPAAKPAEKPAAEKAPSTFRVLLGTKVGMTQVFTKEGDLKAVSVVEAGPCSVLRVKDAAGKDRYSAVLLGYGSRKEKNTSKPLQGQFTKIGIAPLRHQREFRCSDPKGVKAGQTVDLADRFSTGDFVDVTGISKGKGFAGVIKRHKFSGLGASHGASDKERSPGSISSRRSLGRILPGQRMAGHMGAVRVTVQKVEVIEVKPDKNLIYLNGSVPGARGSLVVIRETVKHLKRRKARVMAKKDLKASEILKARKIKAQKKK
ncbi:50S ribosomal protein L3 [Elusimicrobiota bacterium]